MYIYLRLMGCVMWIVGLIATICIIIGIARAFMTSESGMKKFGLFMCLLGNIVITSAFGILFYQVANLIK